MTVTTFHTVIIEGQEERTHSIYAYTDGSKNDIGVGSGIVIFSDNSLTTCLKYRLNERCSNNQAEQLAILKALEYLQYMKGGEKNSPSTHRQQDNTSIAKKSEETQSAHRPNQEKGDRNGTTGMESGI